jgi:hypothetical protein
MWNSAGMYRDLPSLKRSAADVRPPSSTRILAKRQYSTYICDGDGGLGMLKNTTMNLPDELVARVRAYAAENRTTMTAIVREHFEAITEPEKDISDEDPLLAYSKGLLSKREAVRRLGLRDYADLLVTLGDADLPMPLPPAHEIENQAATFVKIWRMG